MRQTARFGAAVATILFALGPLQADEPHQHLAPTAAALAAKGYSLTVRFQGLIGWKQDGKAVWALLPDAWYDLPNYSNNTPATELPPGVKSEVPGVDPKGFLGTNYPPHKATIAITGIKPTAGIVPGIEYPADGYLIALNYPSLMSAYPLGIALDEILVTSDFPVLNSGLNKNLAALGTLHTDILKTLKLNQRPAALATALKISTGSLVAYADLTLPRTYSAQSPTASCKLTSPTSRALAEEARLLDRLDAGATIDVSFGGNTYTLAHDGSPGGIQILVKNSASHIAMKEHPLAFRWFYNLIEKPPAKSRQYIPCCLTCQFGGNKCPFLLFN